MSTFFKTAGGQNAFTIEERVSDYAISYPLAAAEPTALVIKADFMQMRANYARPNANAVLSYNGANAYFVDDEGFSDATSGVTTWRRTWATIPADWSDYQETTFSFPAYIAGLAFGTTFNVTNISTSGTDILLTTNATNVSANDDLFIDLSFTRNSTPYRLTFREPALSASSGVSVTIRDKLPGSGNVTAVSGTLREGQTYRVVEEQLVVTARVLHEYALTSDASLDTDLPAIEKFTPVDSIGTKINSLNAGTIPTAESYHAMIKAGTEIAAERSSRMRFLGNIYVRKTMFINAR